jgi:hypothetical protein
MSNLHFGIQTDPHLSPVLAASVSQGMFMQPAPVGQSAVVAQGLEHTPLR